MMSPADLHETFRLIAITRNAIASQMENLTATLLILDKLVSDLKRELDPGGHDA